MSVPDLTVSLRTDKARVANGERLQLTITVRNNSSSARTLEFSSGCQTDYEFLDVSGQVAAESGQMCTQTLTQRTVAGGSSFSNTHNWTRGMRGVPELSPGIYQVRGILLLTGSPIRSAPVQVTLP